MSEQEPISGSSRDYGSTAAPPTVGFSEFSPTEIYNLCEEVANNVNTINTGLKSLKKIMKQFGGPNDNIQLRNKIYDLRMSVNGCVSVTTHHIQRLGVLARRGDKSQKLQAERLTQAFKDALANYSSVQKQVTEKMVAHMPRQARDNNDPEALERQAIADDEEATLIANQQVQARQIQFDTGLLLEKEAYIHKIEADVLDVNQIMQELAEMVEVQGQIVDTVETHIEEADASVEAGVDELAKAAEYQRRYRKKMFILILIAVIVGIVFVIWIVRAFR